MSAVITEQMLREFVTLCQQRGYQIKKELGGGSFGRTYLAFSKKRTDTSDDGRRAIKLALASGVLRDDGNGFKAIVMECMEITLLEHLANQPGYCLRESDVRYFTRQIAAGLLYIHERKLTHRDMKPENILLKKNPIDGKWILKIADFGFVNDSGAMSTILGTKEYMAPEIIAGKKYGPEVDLWALGCIVYFMLNGSLHTSGIDMNKIDSYVSSVEAFELKDNELRKFSDASKDFVKSLMTADVGKRLKFNELTTHPFLAPSFHFTIAINRQRGLPILFSAPFNPTQIKEKPITWGHIANYIYANIRSIEGVPTNSSIVIAANGVIVNPQSTLSPDLLASDTVNVYMFFAKDMPRIVSSNVAPVNDFNPQEVDTKLGGRQDPEAIQMEARFYSTKKDEYYTLLSQAGNMRAEALRFVGELDKACQDYVTTYLAGPVREANKKLGMLGITDTLPVMTTGGTEEMLRMQGAQDMSFLEGMVDDVKFLGVLCRDISYCNAADKRIRSTFFKFRNHYLHGLVAAIRKEINSYVNSWNTIAKLIGFVSSIMDLKNVADAVVSRARTRDEGLATLGSYMARFNYLMCNNPTWKQTSNADAGVKGEAAAKAEVLILRERLRQAEARVKKLEDENETLRTTIKSLEYMYSQPHNTKI